MTDSTLVRSLLGLVYAPTVLAHSQRLYVDSRPPPTPQLCPLMRRQQLKAFVVISFCCPSLMYPTGKPVRAAIFGLC